MINQLQIDKEDIPQFNVPKKCVMCGAPARYLAWRSYEPLCEKHLVINDEAKKTYERK